MLGLLLCCTLSTAWSFQAVEVKGKVTSEDGVALPGVIILEKDTNNGTVSDIDGNYTISIASPESVLVFSLIGFGKQEVTVGNQSSIDITLAESEELLDEIVVVAMVSKRNSTLPELYKR